MGRPRKPTAKKEVEGTLRPDRAPASEPRPAVEEPPCPPWLSRRAREHWERVAPLLLQQRVLATTDEAALVLYCELYAEFGDLTERIHKRGAGGGRYYKAGQRWYSTPWSRERRDTAKRLAAAAAALGLSPTDRGKVERLPDEGFDLQKMLWEPTN